MATAPPVTRKPAAERPAAPATPAARLRRLQEMGAAPFAVLIVLAIAVGVWDPTFFQAASLLSLLEQAGPLTLLAIGQGLVILTGRIDLSNAGLASLAGVVLAKGLDDWGPLAIVAAVGGATLCGLLMGLIHVTTQVPSFIVTLGFLGVFSGVSLTTSRADSILVGDGFAIIEWIYFRIFGLPISYVLVLLIGIALMVWLKVFPVGRRIRAIGLNERAAALSGIRTNRIVVTVFTASGLMAGLAAVLQVARLQSAGASTSSSLMLPAIAAVIVGGTAISGGIGGVGRTLCGALVIALLQVGLDLVGIDAAVQPIVYGAIVILAIAATVDRKHGISVA